MQDEVPVAVGAGEASPFHKPAPKDSAGPGAAWRGPGGFEDQSRLQAVITHLLPPPLIMQIREMAEPTNLPGGRRLRWSCTCVTRARDPLPPRGVPALPSSPAG